MRKAILSLCIFIAAVGLTILPAGAQDSVVRLVTHDSFNASEEVLAAFEEETGLTVEILRLGDAGTMVNQSILSKENPLGDVLYGIDNTFLTRALDAELFVPYESPRIEVVYPSMVLPGNEVTPIDFGDVCLNYDVSAFEESGLPLPESLADLTRPEYAGTLIVQNPATSSPGLAFLLATIDVFGEEGEYTYLDYWQDLVANDVFIANDWTDAYYGQFSGSAGSEGNRPLVVSYASSPPVEVLFADPPTDIAPTGAIVNPGTCFRQIEYAGVLANAANPEGAQQFIDFMLGETFQEDMPLQMFVYPVNMDAELPELFVEFTTVPEEPVVMPIATIDEGRDRWIQAWTETVLR
ncbi:MAG: thiamine ABC transporter substrate-binding protein [Chloroflexi bacterium]|nr:thiamine ABC transporter substrate-binding protein [Chloroflexota bacterium]